MRADSNFADPFAVVPYGLERGEIAAVENIFGGGNHFAALEVLISVAGADGDELHHARITVAINHATRAAVTDEFGLVELVDVAHGGFPGVTAVEVQVPIEIKIFVAAQATEF